MKETKYRFKKDTGKAPRGKINSPFKWVQMGDAITNFNEKSADAGVFKQDLEEEHEPGAEVFENIPDTSKNLSQPDDRSEDLAEYRDPFTQLPEKDTQIPPELVQRKAYELYEQRGYEHGQDLSDWFEAERLLRSEFKFRLLRIKRQKFGVEI